MLQKEVCKECRKKAYNNTDEFFNGTWDHQFVVWCPSPVVLEYDWYLFNKATASCSEKEKLHMKKIYTRGISDLYTEQLAINDDPPDLCQYKNKHLFYVSNYG